MPPARDKVTTASQSDPPTPSLSASASTQSQVQSASSSQPETRTPSSRKRGGRTKGSRNYLAPEIAELLRLVDLHLPSGSDAWDVVAAHYNTKFPERQRDGESLKTKFQHIRDTPKETGDPDYPPDTVTARKIDDKIKAKEAQFEVGGERFVAAAHRTDDSRGGDDDQSATLTPEPPSPTTSESSSVSTNSSLRYNAVHGVAAVKQKRKHMSTIFENIVDKLEKNAKSDELLADRLMNMEKRLMDQQREYAAESAARQREYAAQSAARQHQSNALNVQLTETLALIAEKLRK